MPRCYLTDSLVAACRWHLFPKHYSDRPFSRSPTLYSDPFSHLHYASSPVPPTFPTLDDRVQVSDRLHAFASGWPPATRCPRTSLDSRFSHLLTDRFTVECNGLTCWESFHVFKESSIGHNGHHHISGPLSLSPSL